MEKLQRFSRTLAHRVRAVSNDSEYIFVLSHMRSYSTLLSHIVGSSPEVSGYCETHTKYRWSGDLLRLRVKAYGATPSRRPGRYVLDKILHNNLVIWNAVLRHPSLKIIFLVRRPQETIASIMNMGHTLVDISWYRDPESVTSYYVDRLRYLADIAERRERPALLIRAEDILARTDEVLASITDYLDLGAGLDEEYSIFEKTGKPWHGDASASIRQGRIVRGLREEYHDVVVPESCLARARSAYDACCERIAAACAAASPVAKEQGN